MADDGEIVYRSLKKRHLWTRRLLITSMIATFLSLPSSFFDLEVSRFVFSNVDYFDSPVEFAILGSLAFFVLAYVAAMIAFFMWTYRAARNVRANGATDLKTSPGWAVGWYFIPIMFLWKPYQALREIWKAALNPLNPNDERLPASFGLWWALAVVGQLIDNFTMRAESRAAGTEDYYYVALIDAFSSLVSLIVLFLTLRIVNVITMALEERGTKAVFE